MLDQEIPTEALNDLFYKAMDRARRENKTLGLSNLIVIDGQLVEEKPDGTLVPLGKKALYGKMVKVKKGTYTIKK